MSTQAIHLPLARPELRGTILAGLSGMLFGLMGFFGTHLFYLDISVTNMLFWRFLIATIVIAAMLVFRKKTLKSNAGATSLIKIFILGALSYSGASFFYFLACKAIGTGLAMVIFFSFPVFVTLFAWLAGSWRVNRHAISALLAVITGLVFLKGHGEHTVQLGGVMLAVTAAFSFAAYVYGSKHTTKGMDSGLLALLVCCGNTLIFLALSLWDGSFIIPGSMTAWFYICAIGIIATALPIQLLLDGLKYISPVKASILSVLEPVVTLLVGITMLNETMSAVQALGVFIVLSGAVLIQFEK
jgi:drug/metabolite transporter (DMT)-like permease